MISGAFSDILSILEATGRGMPFIWFFFFPVVFYFLFKILWMDFVQDKFRSTTDHIILEIIPPRDIEKSPKPMESIFSGMSGILAGFSALDEYVVGKFTPNFSLEIVSNEGSVHFFIRTPVFFRNLLEAHIYAQYPYAEIIEAPDYISEVPLVIPNKNWDLWGCDFELTRPDPYPIKTYKWFEETVTGTMIDPLASMIETIGKLGLNQKIWLQYIITPEPEGWYNTGREVIDEITGKTKPKPEGVFSQIFKGLVEIFNGVLKGIFGPVEFAGEEAEKKDEAPLEFRLTPGEKDALKALEESVGKNVFKTKMRFMYLGRRENFDKTVISSFVGSIKQFSDLNLNGFKPEDTSKTYSTYLFAKERLLYRQRKLFRRYRERDSSGKRFILNTEELATVFHLPDISVEAPALRRVEAKRGGAPINLPI